MMTPSGGGSGGSLFLQVNLDTQNSGLISATGGERGFTIGNAGDSLFRGSASYGGKGSDGIIPPWPAAAETTRCSKRCRW